MYILLTILIVIAAILLTLLVLVQNSKGGGLAAGFSMFRGVSDDSARVQQPGAD